MFSLLYAFFQARLDGEVNLASILIPMFHFDLITTIVCRINHAELS